MDLTQIEIIPVSARHGTRKSDPVAMAAGTAGVIVAVVIMLLLPVISSAFESEEPGFVPVKPFEFVEARLLKLGEIKDDTKLPDRVVPPKATAPEEVLPLDTNENKPEPPKKAEEKKEIQPDAVPDDKLREVFEKARAFAEIQDDFVPEGHPDGVPDGDVTDPALASMGATYGRRIMRLIQERWVVPTLISDTERNKLKVKIILKFDPEMTIIDFKILKKSGNKLFDDSVSNAIEQLQKDVKHLPEPPDEIAPNIYGGGLAVNLYGADAPVQ